MAMTSSPMPTKFGSLKPKPPRRGSPAAGIASGLIRDFGDGKPHAINAFGQKLVVFRSGSTRDGKINVLDSYCRHMGGDLSQGEVKGDEIACPFHDWRWGGDGRCKQVPYARRTPRLARTATWTTLEQDGMLFVWNDPEGKPPPPEVTIPRIEGATSDEWTDWHWYTTVVGSNCREIIDNVVDMAHFFYIHGSLPTYFKNIFEGHVATQYMNGAGRPDMGGTEGAQMLGTTSVASYFGPSFMIDDLTYHYESGDAQTILINCHYPIDSNSFVLQYGIIVKKSETLPGDAGHADRDQARRLRQDGLRAGRRDLATQGAHRQPAAGRGGRPGVSAAPLVPAVLCRCSRCAAGHVGPLRI